MATLRDGYAEELKSHFAWLMKFEGDPRHKEKKCKERWELMLKNDWEAATVEACTRQFLETYVDCVEPNEHPSLGGPDFICYNTKGRFYVEATCMELNTVALHTQSGPEQKGTAHYSGPMSLSISRKCSDKAGKVCDLDLPCLLAIGTLHEEGRKFGIKAYVQSALMGDTSIKMGYDPEEGVAVGVPWHTTRLDNAAFCRSGSEDCEPVVAVRSSISGLLLFGFHCQQTIVTGVLHPNSARQFAPSMLPGVDFGRLEGGYSKGELCVTWD
jgi:hypothetical protein